MGFRDKKVTAVYASPSKGFLSVRTEEGDQYGKFKATPRKLTKGAHEGETIWELHFPSYEGLLKNVSFNRARQGSQYGDQVVFEFEDEEMETSDRFRKIRIQVDLDSTYSTQFIMCCENIDIAEPIEVEPFYIARTDKVGSFNSGWGFYQEGERIQKTIKKEDLPKVVEIPRKGKPSDYNRDDLIEFVEEQLIKFMKKNKFGDFKPKEGADEAYTGSGKKPRQPVQPDEDDDVGDASEETEEEPAKKPAAAKGKAKQAPPEDEEDE